MTGQCGHCGLWHEGRVCPRVKAIDYYPDGTVKRVEYHDPAPRAPRPEVSPGGFVMTAGLLPGASIAPDS